ncbi:Ligand-gated ion channel [Necator americanus]|uniref:Ligand-gated ion channel n=1 Tax=Necator americanus TaxID=51031 RepID=W2SN67_NECAM|nr:Ligand-gated ion channel [Necator americanus]ETN71134.1 Ligand-gated ion channel [Necator americanus]
MFQLNFSYSIYEVEDGSFGSMDQNGNWNGLIGALGIVILNEILLIKPVEVLEWPVWLCIIAAYLFTSSTLWLFEKFSPYSYTNSKERYINDTEKREFSLKECLWFCMTSLTPQGEIFVLTCCVFHGQSLTCRKVWLNIAFNSLFSSLDDLAKQYKIEYAPIKGSASEAYFRRMAEIEERFYNIWKEMSLNESMSLRDRARLTVWDYPVSDKFTNMWRYMQESTLPDNMDAAVQRVLTSEQGFAFIGDATEIKYAVLTNCNLQQVGTEFSRKPYAIAVQTGHVLKDQISSAILMLLNRRRLETLKEKWWNSNPNKVVCADINNENDGISIQNIGGVFMVILCGIALSVISLTLEFFYYRLKRVHFIGERQEDKDEKSISELNGSTASRFVWSNSMVRGKSRCTFNYENTGFQY